MISAFFNKLDYTILIVATKVDNKSTFDIMKNKVT